MGEADTSAWTTPPTYKVPKVTAPSGGWENGTIADYLGVPTKVPNIKVNALPFRAFAKIYDYFFRDENVQDHVNCPTDAVNRTGVNTGNYVTDMHLGGKVPYANKLHDAFTSCLPNTQKAGEPASIAFGNVAPIITGDDYLPNTSLPSMHLGIDNKSGITGDKYSYLFMSKPTFDGNFSDGKLVSYSDFSTNVNGPQNLWPTNLYADLRTAGSVSVPELRTAFQVQRFLELLARTGTRYNEAIKAIYDVTVPDYRAMMPEYLGGSRIDINIQQVVNMTSPSADSDDPLGTIGAYSLTNSSGASWTKSFVEAGFVIGRCGGR